MQPITERPLSERVLRLRQKAYASPEGYSYPEILQKCVPQGKFILLGKAWKYFYTHCNLLFSEDDIFPGLDLKTPIPGWDDAVRELREIPETELSQPDLPSPWKDLPGLFILGGNHAVPGYDQIIREGFPCRLERIRQRLSGETDPVKRDFLQYLQLRCEGILIFYSRMSEFLSEKISAAENENRKQEILKLAKTFKNISEGPAKTFWDAMMIHQTVYQEIPDSPGCLDRYFEDFVQHDIQSGELSVQDVFDYICAAYIKFFETRGPLDKRSGTCHMSLGGRYADHSPACGLCTELCMAAQASLKMIRPQIALRWAADLPEDFLLRGVELLKESGGNTDFSNDEVFIPALGWAGIPESDACTYSPSGCNEVMIPGQSQMGALQGHFNLPILLNLLFGQISLPDLAVPDWGKLKTFEDFRMAFRQLQQSFFRYLHRITDQIDQWRGKTGFMLPLSLYTADCIERALPIHSGGARYAGCNYDVDGFTNLADSMYVIKLLVYEQKRLSLGEFAEILKANWKGAELLQAEIKSRIPHFGNDNEEVDSLAAELFREAVEDFDSEPPLRGGHYNMGTLGGYENAHIYLAEKTFATPDGRRNGEAFASGLSPWASMDRNGPTALLNSICKIPFDRTCTSTIINLMLPSSMLDSEDGRKKAAVLLEAYFKKGGIQAQITVADKELLLAAEKEPEKYPDLIVRVSGYCAKFVSLTPKVRAEIVRRTVSGENA